MIAYATTAGNTIGADPGVSVDAGELLYEDAEIGTDDSGHLDESAADAILTAGGFARTGPWTESGGQWAARVERVLAAPVTRLDVASLPGAGTLTAPVTQGAIRAYPPTHRYCGSDTERQQVGDPGHCEACAEFGHVKAHPYLGCGDVGCYADHDDDSAEATS